MGRLVEGKWETGWGSPSKGGKFERATAPFRDQISSAKDSPHPPEGGRYHLYVSYACPWAHRTLLTRALRGLEDTISVTAVSPLMGEGGWEFSAEDPDPVFGAKYLREVYLNVSPEMTGRVTVPVLFDKKTRTIVNNESREVMRILDTEFEAFAKNPVSLAPTELRNRIDEVLTAIYEPINNGVYRAGFATKQEAYDKAVLELFHALDTWEGVLAKQRFLTGNSLTECDLALFTTLLRFDLVYYGHFKCNVRRIADYPNLYGFLRDIYQRPEVKSVCRLDQIKTHYYWSQDNVNPTRIVPKGPAVDLDSPHDRARFG